jgi:hypothetical protein
MELTPPVAAYRAGLTETNQAIFDCLVVTAQAVDPDMQDAIKWRVPTFTVHANWHHWLFSISQTQKGLTLTFHKGWLLADPTHALHGDGKHLRQMLFTAFEQIRPEVVAGLMAEALAHQVDME